MARSSAFQLWVVVDEVVVPVERRGQGMSVGTAMSRLGHCERVRGVGGRLRELHEADRVALSAWWKAQSAASGTCLTVETAERHHRVRDSRQRQRQRITGGISYRQRTWAERAIKRRVDTLGQ
jgi:hypothetical protein